MLPELPERVTNMVAPVFLPQTGSRNEDTLTTKQEEIAPLSKGTADDVCPPTSHSAPSATPRPANQLPSVQLGVLAERLAKAEHDLNEEKRTHQQTKLDLKQKHHDAVEFRRSWLDTVNELNRYLRLGHGHNQLTDDDLIRRVTHLRQKITTFSAQHFSDELHDPKATKTGHGLFKDHMAISQTEYEGYMRSASLRVNLIQAFLWAFFRDEIFGKFCWMTQRSGASAYQIYKSFGQYYVA